MFRVRPSLASGATTCLLGILLLIPAAALVHGGLQQWWSGTGIWAPAFLGAGVLLLLVAATALGVGIWSIQMFERKLLVAVASRGRVVE